MIPTDFQHLQRTCTKSGTCGPYPLTTRYGRGIDFARGRWNGAHPCLHLIGFRDDRYWNAVKVWGRPEYIHMGWDLRARREIDVADIVVFAEGEADQAPRVRSFDDIREEWLLPVSRAGGEL